MNEQRTPHSLRNRAFENTITRKATKHWSFRKPRKTPQGAIQINNRMLKEV